MATPLIYVSEHLHPDLQQLCVKLLVHKSKATHYQIIPQSQLVDNLKMVPHEGRPPNVIGWDATANRPPPHMDIVAYVSHIAPTGAVLTFTEPVTPETEQLVSLLAQCLPHVFLNLRDNHKWLRNLELHKAFIEEYHSLYVSRQLVTLGNVQLEAPELQALKLSIGPLLLQIQSHLPAHAFEVKLTHEPPEGCKILALYEPRIPLAKLADIPNFLNYVIHALGNHLQRPSTNMHEAFPILLNVLALYKSHMSTLSFPTEHERLNTLHKLAELPEILLQDKVI